MDSSEGTNSGKRSSPESGTELEEETPRVVEEKYRSRMELDEETQNLRVLEQKKSWRFTYEALTHLRSLRLFLFNSTIPVPWRFVSLQATIASESPFSTSPVVLCQWVSPEGEPRKVFVPMPVCLIDYSVPLVASACSDHVEIKLKLLSSGGSFVDDLSLLGFTYRGEPIGRDDAAAGVKIHSLKGDDSVFCLDSDAELLASKKHGVTFYCRHCSAKLTKQPICAFRGLPSTEWRELADHWFGMCCCREGVHTKSLMARFEEFLIPAMGLCLVGTTTCNVYCNDLVSSVVDQNQNAFGEDDAPCIPMAENGDETRPADDLDAVMSCREIDGNVLCSADLQPWVDDLKPLKDPFMPANGCSHDAMEELVGPAACCSHSGVSHENVVSEDSGADKLPDHGIKAKSPANGFMSSFPSSTLSPFRCYNCAGLTGVRSGEREEGVQLFKCHISSDLPTGGPLDVFRFHTLERVFSYELFSSAEEDSSYRYIVRDLTTRMPLLQLVLINHESWICSGFCVEEQKLLSEPEKARSTAVQEMSVVTGHADIVKDALSSQDCGLMPNLGRGKFLPLFLEPVMKVMFCDTSSFDSDELSEVENWGRKNQSDDIYMLDGEVKSLARSLEANGSLFPESCGAFQQFHFSFLAR